MTDASKDELDLLGDEDVEAFSGSQANLEGAAKFFFHLLHATNPYILRHYDSVQSEHGSDPKRSNHDSEQSRQPEQVYSGKAKKHLDKRKHKVRSKYISQSSSSEESQSSVQVKKCAEPKRAPSEQDKQQTDPVFIGR